ncbi:MAG: YceI family protein, partial [Bacteroidota bacterium]
ATAEATTFKVSSTDSEILWVGSKVGGQHDGSIKISDGQLKIKDGNIEAGSFTIDMNSIENKDLPDEKKGDLVGHLKTGDFFETEKFPKGTFTITGVQAVTGKPDVTHSITGDLKLKDVTKSVTFDANVQVVGDKVMAVTPAFTINRTEWGINFKSGILGVAKDKAISDDIGLTIQLQAAKV